jgi:hypothetical protein
MAIYAVVRKIGGNHPFVYCMCETSERAKSLMEHIKTKIPDDLFSVEKVKDSCLIGDYLENVIIVEQSSRLTSLKKI